MLERLLLPKDHAIAILMKDHDAVKELFDRFEKAEAKAEKTKIIEAAVMELKIHATIEEEIFYPAVRKSVGAELMNEADEEHHVARVLIAELDLGRDNDHRDAKFTVLAESIRHHIKEEEGQMLPKSKAAEVDFRVLGEEMLARKEELKANGVPPDAEHAMVANANGKVDSPAAKSRAKSRPAKSRAKSRPAKAPTKTRAAKSRTKSKKAKSGGKATSAKARRKSPASKTGGRGTSAKARGRASAGKSGRKASRKSR